MSTKQLVDSSQIIGKNDNHWLPEKKSLKNTHTWKLTLFGMWMNEWKNEWMKELKHALSFIIVKNPTTNRGTAGQAISPYWKVYFEQAPHQLHWNWHLSRLGFSKMWHDNNMIHDPWVMILQILAAIYQLPQEVTIKSKDKLKLHYYHNWRHSVATVMTET